MKSFNLSWLDLDIWKERMQQWLYLAGYPFTSPLSVADYERLRGEFILGMRRAGATDDQVKAGLAEFNRQIASEGITNQVAARMVELGNRLDTVIVKTAETVGKAAGAATKPLIPVLGLAAVGLVATAVITRRV